MLAVRRARLLSARPFGLILLGLAVACAALYLDDASDAGCGWPTVLLYLAAGVAVASLPVRLPGSVVSLLPAILLPAWLSCGVGVSSALAVAAVLIAVAFARSSVPMTLRAAARALTGVFVGDLTGWAVLGVVPPLASPFETAIP